MPGLNLANFHGMTRDPTSRVKNFVDRVAPPASQVPDTPGFRLYAYQGLAKSFREIKHMDIVTHAGSIWRGMFRPEDVQSFPKSQREVQSQWDQVSLWMMVFS